jgi:hypothetical protein
MSNKILKWLVLLVLVLFIIAIIIFIFRRPSFSENQVILSLEGPTQLAVGDEAVYKLKYSNQTKLELKNLKFNFIYPEGAIVLKDNKVVKEPTDTFNLSNLKSGESGEREFRAFVTGDRGNIKTAKVELEFKAGSLRSTFTKTTSVSTTLTSIPVFLSLAAPPKLISGQTINYILDYRNESGKDISDIKFEFVYPDGFTVQEKTPSSLDQNTWSISSLKKNEGGRISIKGILKGKEGEIKKVSVILKRNINGEFIDYQMISTSSVISNPILSTDIVLQNGNPDYSARLGEVLKYKIKYANNSNLNLIGLTLEVKLEGEMYDFNFLDTNGGFYESSSNTIFWNAAVLSDLSVLPPNKSGEINFSIKLKDSFPSGGAGSRSFYVKASSKIKTPNVPTNFDEDEISATSSLITKIITNPSFNQSAFYNDPAFGYFGPMPPKVGQETIFTIHWQVINPSSNMNNVEIKALLPPGVTWKNVVSVGLGQSEPTFNPNSSEVRWNIGVLPQGTGVITPKYEASFQVGIKPSTTKQIPLLIKDAQFSGIDSYTKELIILKAKDLTANDLIDIPFQGTVEL